MRASVESYSIKKMEVFYGFEREVDLRDAGSSIVAFEEWLELGEGERPASDHLDRIERYNRDDVVSNRELRDWLEGRRDRARGAHRTARPAPGAVGKASCRPELTEAQAHVRDLADRLAAGIPEDRADRDEDQHATWLLAQLLGWHRREDKSMWWEFFRWMLELTPEELVDESEPIGRLEPDRLIEDLGDGKQTWRYRFPDQDSTSAGTTSTTRRRPSPSPTNRRSSSGARVTSSRSTGSPERSTSSATPRTPTRGPWCRSTGSERPTTRPRSSSSPNGWRTTASPPRARTGRRATSCATSHRASDNPLAGALAEPDETDLEAAIRPARRSIATTLPIQGPPGSGKTYAGARMILALLADGKRVGITATSHKVIGNLIRAVQKAARTAAPGAGRSSCGSSSAAIRSRSSTIPPSTRGKNPGDVRSRLDDGRATLAAGTSWLWASTKMIDAVDVLFVDEAGQISLANVIAIARATKSLVLLGDPQQLDQPLRGTHPPGADRSALAHILDGRATMPPDRGLFLESTWRLHPDLCAFTSEVFYDDRLEPRPALARQRSIAPCDAGRRRGTATPRRPDDRRRQRIARRGRGGRRGSLARLVEGGATWVDEHGSRAADRLGRRPDRGPVQRPGRR